MVGIAVAKTKQTKMISSDWALFSLSTVGLATIVTQSKLFLPIRDFADRKIPFIGQLLHCSMCFGFWAGIMIGSNFWSPVFYPVQWALLGFAGSWLSWAATVLLHFLGSDNL